MGRFEFWREIGWGASGGIVEVVNEQNMLYKYMKIKYNINYIKLLII